MLFKNVFLSICMLFFSSFLFSESLDSDLVLGIESYERKEYISTIHYLNKVLSKKNDYNNEALFWKAKSYYNLKYYNDSKNILEIFFSSSDFNTEYYEDAKFLYAKIHFQIKKYDDALLLFNQIYRNKLYKHYTDSALFWIGECYIQLSELDKAKQSFKDYLAKNSDSPNALSRLDLISNMEKILINKTNKNISVEDKAYWLIDYILYEINKNPNGKISRLLDSFSSKNDAIKWLNESDFTENNELLDELESKILEKLGDVN